MNAYDRMESTALVGADVSGIDLRGANLRDACFDEADLTGATFRGARGEIVDVAAELADAKREIEALTDELRVAEDGADAREEVAAFVTRSRRIARVIRALDALVAKRAALWSVDAWAATQGYDDGAEHRARQHAALRGRLTSALLDAVDGDAAA